MKHKLIAANIILIVFLTSCAKKTNKVALAKNYYEQGLVASEKNNREALVLVDKSLSTNPTDRAYALKATLLYQIGKYKESLKYFEKVLSNKKAGKTLKADVSNNYACNLLVLNKKDAARKVWIELTSDRFYLSPEVAWFNLGLLILSNISDKEKYSKIDIAKLREATIYFKKAIKLNQDYVDSYYYLSLVLIKLGKIEEARQELIQVVGIMPEHETAQALLKQLEQKSKVNSI